MRVVCDNSRDGACFKLEKANMVAKKAMVQTRQFLKMYSLQLIITVQLYYLLSKNPSVKIWSNKFQMVMINYNKLCMIYFKYH